MENNERWTLQSGICYKPSEYQGFLKIGCGEVAAWAYLEQSPEVCQFGADLISWLFMFDDRFGEAPLFATRSEMDASFESFIDLILDMELPEDSTPFHSALLELMHRAQDFGPKGWNVLFAKSIERYTAGCKQEFALRYEGHHPSLDEYVEIRRKSIGTYPILDVLDLDLDEILAEDPRISRCRDMTADLLGWVNDMFSFRKEFLDEDPCNLVKVISNSLNLEYEDAYEYAIVMHDRRFNEFFAVYEEISNDPSISDAHRKYIDGLKNWILANHVWASRTLRYHW